MSETALRNVNAVLLSERRSIGAKKAPMKVVLTGTNDENLDVCRSKGGRAQLPVVVPKTKTNLNVQMEVQAEPPATEIEYILSEDLERLEDPNGNLETLLSRLDSREWLTTLEALKHARQLALFHSSALQNILHNVVTLVVKALKNPRSALCKTAIMTAADLFKAYRDEMLDVLDPLLLQLLLKATQDKRFVCEEAEKALMGMTSHISPYPCLEKIRPYGSHRNPRVRAKAAKCIYKSVSRLGLEGINQFGMEPLLQIAAAQLNDQLPEAREAARKLLVDLHAVFRQSTPVTKSADEVDVNSPQADPWEQLCLSSLTPLTAQAVLRVTCVAN